jgi:hypothetical protein
MIIKKELANDVKEGLLGVKELRAIMLATGRIPNQEVVNEQMAIYRGRVRAVLDDLMSEAATEGTSLFVGEAAEEIIEVLRTRRGDVNSVHARISPLAVMSDLARISLTHVCAALTEAQLVHELEMDDYDDDEGDENNE